MDGRTDRRGFLKGVAAGAVPMCLGAARGVRAAEAAPAAKGLGPPKNPLPRWRGFNLLAFFQAMHRGDRSKGNVSEDDLRRIRDFGFDFVRLPMDYWLWIDTDWRKTRKLRPDDTFRIKESMLAKIDRAVELCGKYGLHVCLNFHRAPGYCINERGSKREPFDLWKDKRAQDAFVYHWDVFAKRYKSVATRALSFNLVNEAPRPKKGRMSADDYCRIMTRAAKKIRETSGDRIILIDGFGAGNMVVDGLVGSGVAQSVHAYRPGRISHYRAHWVDRKMNFPKPTWPLRKKDGSTLLDRRGLEKLYEPWGRLVRSGVGVHCGEAGCYNRTPHDVFLAWLEDVLAILKSHAIGWALWNFRGPFGVLDSGRKDVAYEDSHGHKVDAKLLKLLQQY